MWRLRRNWQAINQFLQPIRERRAHFEQRQDLIEAILRAGTQRMLTESEETISLVRQAIGLPVLNLQPVSHTLRMSPPGLVYC